MFIRRHKNLIVFLFVLFVTSSGYIWLINQNFFQSFIEWAQENFILYFTILTFMKVLGIVWPPIPGGILTLGSIPVVGWVNALISNILGGLIGSVIAYFLGKKYGYKLLLKLFDEENVEKIKKIKIKKDKELEAVFVLRILYGGIKEVVSYGAGLLDISFKNFFVGIVASSLIDIPVFYLVSNALESEGLILNAIIILLAIVLFYKIKGRYFE